MITFSDLCDISRIFTHQNYLDQKKCLDGTCGIPATTYDSWKRGNPIYIGVMESMRVAESLFQIGGDGFPDNKFNYGRLVAAATEILGEGFLDEVAMTNQYEAEGCRNLAFNLMSKAADNSASPAARQAERNLRIVMGGQHGNLLKGLPHDLAVYNEGIARCADSILTECSIEVEVDVSEWPGSPYGIRQKTREKVSTARRERYFVQPVFRDRLRAETWRCESVVLYSEDGKPVFWARGLPMGPDSSDSLRYDDKWKLSKQSYERSIECNGQIETIRCLDLSFTSESGIRVIARRWDVHSGRYKWIETEPSAHAPHSGQSISGYYCSDLLVDAPESEGMISVEVETSYKSWSVSIARYFTTLAYSPSITARITGAIENVGEFNEFKVQLYTSQSQFWRRPPDSRHLSDVSSGVYDDHNVSIRFSDQWLLPGEGYNITVDASK